MDEIDPELLETYEKLGIPLKWKEMVAGVVAVDAVLIRFRLRQRLRASWRDGHYFNVFGGGERTSGVGEAVFGYGDSDER